MIRQCAAQGLPVELVLDLILLERATSSRAKKQINSRISDLLERAAAGRLGAARAALKDAVAAGVEAQSDVDDLLLESVEIHNFLQFAQTRVDLVHDANRPVVLIEARNGYGKSAFIRAIRFALLGEDEKNTNLSHLIHDGVSKPRGTVRVVLRFRGQQQGLIEVHRVREYSRAGDRWKAEATDLTVNLPDGPLQGAEASEWLDARFPASLLQYFIFDAESSVVQALSGQRGEALPEVRGPVEAALGVAPWRKVAERLREHGKKLRLEAIDLQKQYGSQPDVKKRALEGEKQSISAQLDEQRPALVHATTDLAVLSERIALYTLKLQPSHRQTREALRKEQLRVQADLARLQNEDKDFYRRILPLALLRVALQPKDNAMPVMSADWRKGAEHAVERLVQALVAGHLPWALFDRPDRQSLHKELRGVVGITQTEDQLRARRREERIAPLREVSAQAWDEVLKRPRNRGGEVWRARLLAIESELTALGSEAEDPTQHEMYTQMLVEQAELQTKVQKLTALLGVGERRLEEVQDELDGIAERSAEDKKHLEKAEAKKKGADIADKAYAATVAVADELLKDRIGQLEENTTWMLQHTAHKPEYQKGKIVVDRQTLRYCVLDPNGKPVSAGFSTGERTLLALCLVHGIRSAAGAKFPLMIEAPLKPLDPLHQFAVAQHLFNSYSGQVVLLVKPHEIPKELEYLQTQRVGQRFELVLGNHAHGGGRQTEIRLISPPLGGVHVQ